MNTITFIFIVGVLLGNYSYELFSDTPNYELAFTKTFFTLAGGLMMYVILLIYGKINNGGSHD